MSHSTQVPWSAGASREIDWWRYYLTSSGAGDAEGFQFRFDPDAALQPHIARVLEAQGDIPDPAILDCAAGPATTVGKVLGHVRLNLTAVDALADSYTNLLHELHLTPPVPTQTCTVEELDRRFPPEQFALVYMRFALDHCYDPLEALQQMLRVTRVGGTVMIEHYRDPSETAHAGLRQWDLQPLADDLVVSTSGYRFSVREEFKEAHLQIGVADDWFTLQLRKGIADD